MWSPPILVRRRSPNRLIDDSPDHKNQNYSYGTPGNGFFVGFTPLRPHLLLAGRISNRCIGSAIPSSGPRFQPALTAAYIGIARSAPDSRSTPSYEDVSSVSS